jgi:hypothetical protein
MPLMDHYDWAAVVAVVILTLIGALATGSWPISFMLGAAIGNGCAYLLRRRAGVPDRSLAGRTRVRR